MKNLKVILILAVSLLLCISNVYAYDFGINRTIFDERVGSSTGWYNQGNSPGEDQEVEPPNMITGQVWDLEGFFLRDNRYLSIVSGFNLEGFLYNNYTYRSGDIFLDKDGDAQYGSTADGSVLNSGYDYVIDVDWSDFTYNVYALSSNSVLLDVFEYNSPESSPWRYDGVKLEEPSDRMMGYGNFNYLSGKSDSEIGNVATGGLHYVAQDFDLSFLSFLPAGTTVTAHFTMECGNDNLMGQGQVAVPEPTTLLLLGFGLVGLAGVGRKFKK